MRTGADCRRYKRLAVRQPRYHRTLHPLWRLNLKAPHLAQSRRPVALRPHLSVGLPKDRSQYA